MNKRIKKLRREMDLTQEKFGARIGVKGNTVAQWESGRNDPPDSAIAFICKEFGVNEEWLRDGTGEMFRSSPNTTLDALAAEFHLDRAAYVAIEKFLKLSPELREGMIAYLGEVAAALATPEDENDFFRGIPQTEEEFEQKYPPIDMTQNKEIG